MSKIKLGIVNAEFEEIQKAVDNHPAIKGKTIRQNATLLNITNDYGANIAVGFGDCGFRKAMSERGYTVARQSIAEGSIGFSPKMWLTRRQECVKIVVAFLYYRNGLLMNDKGEVVV